MPQLRVSLRALEGIPSGSSEAKKPDLENWLREQYSFLPQPLAIELHGDQAVLTFPELGESAQAEAALLAQRASKRATEGNYDKAIGIFQRVLELQPSLHSARRDLAMAYVEKGDVDNATDHLVEVLRVDPKDAWSWVVLANLYIREKRDPETGERFLRRALEIKPDDAWALKSLAAVAREHPNTETAGACRSSRTRSPWAHIRRGCGNGGLDWREVKPLIEKAAAGLPAVAFIVFEPGIRGSH